ncbi:MAG: protoheme IX farnesyltransferase [Alphaproteobacteria bacterium]|nr:protoheme IX farnesyltransferase [Alphaproteobacteria bacterium]
MSEIGSLAALPRSSAAEPALRDYVAVLKPRVMSLVVFTGLVGLVMAPAPLHPLLALVAVLCIGIAAGAAGAINNWYDRDIDRLMTRTRDRAVPAGRMAPETALGFGCTLATFAVVVMGLALNWLAAALLAASVLFYVVVYTMWLKRATPQNIVIGGAAGAFPPVIGWAAATGDIAPAAMALFLIIFVWTPPHFWALALFRAGEYARAGVPMLPVVAGAARTRRDILLYSVALLPVSLLPAALGTGGRVYVAGAVVLGLLFIVGALGLRQGGGEAPARRLFGFSILYLFLLFALLVIERQTGLVS